MDSVTQLPFLIRPEPTGWAALPLEIWEKIFICFPSFACFGRTSLSCTRLSVFVKAHLIRAPLNTYYEQIHRINSICLIRFEVNVLIEPGLRVLRTDPFQYDPKCSPASPVLCGKRFIQHHLEKNGIFSHPCFGSPTHAFYYELEYEMLLSLAPITFFEVLQKMINEYFLYNLHRAYLHAVKVIQENPDSNFNLMLEQIVLDLFATGQFESAILFSSHQAELRHNLMKRLLNSKRHPLGSTSFMITSEFAWNSKFIQRHALGDLVKLFSNKFSVIYSIQYIDNLALCLGHLLYTKNFVCVHDLLIHLHETKDLESVISCLYSLIIKNNDFIIFINLLNFLSQNRLLPKARDPIIAKLIWHPEKIEDNVLHANLSLFLLINDHKTIEYALQKIFCNFSTLFYSPGYDSNLTLEHLVKWLGILIEEMQTLETYPLKQLYNLLCYRLKIEPFDIIIKPSQTTSRLTNSLIYFAVINSLNRLNLIHVNIKKFTEPYIANLKTEDKNYFERDVSPFFTFRRTEQQILDFRDALEKFQMEQNIWRIKKVFLKQGYVIPSDPNPELKQMTDIELIAFFRSTCSFLKSLNFQIQHAK